MIVFLIISAVPDMYSIQADATAYFGSVLTNSTPGTEVFHFRIVIDLSRFGDDLSGIVTIMNRNNLVDSIFRFSDLSNQRTFTFGSGIDAANASGRFPEIRLLQNRLVVFEDFIIYQQAPPPSLNLPTTLDFDMSVLVVAPDQENTQSLRFAVGAVDLIPPPGEYRDHWLCTLLSYNAVHAASRVYLSIVMLQYYYILFYTYRSM